MFFISLQLIFLFYCAKYTPLVLDGYVYPAWANVIGWLLSFASILCIPGYFVYYVSKTPGSLREVRVELMIWNWQFNLFDITLPYPLGHYSYHVIFFEMQVIKFACSLPNHRYANAVNLNTKLKQLFANFWKKSMLIMRKLKKIKFEWILFSIKKKILLNF